MKKNNPCVYLKYNSDQKLLLEKLYARGFKFGLIDSFEEAAKSWGVTEIYSSHPYVRITFRVTSSNGAIDGSTQLENHLLTNSIDHFLSYVDSISKLYTKNLT